ncbi:MAG: class I tRNA ligase family protein, partial [Patescibacteria group bacterium]
EDKIKGYKHFSNKLWNIARFVLSQERDGKIKENLKAEFDALAVDVTNDIEEFRIYMAAEKLYHYLWHRFADGIIEESKGKDGYGATLYYILENSLKLLHPFMPFITEEIWQSMPTRDAEFLMVAKWPSLSALK